MKRTLSIFAVALVAGLLGGYGSSPTLSFYTLMPNSTLPRLGEPAPVCVVVSTVTISEPFDRPQIVVSRIDNQVQPNEFQRWAESQKGDIQRTIAADLCELLGTEYATVFESDPSGPPTWSVRVDVMRFDSVPGNAAAVEARWTIWPQEKWTLVFGHSLAHERVQG